MKLNFPGLVLLARVTFLIFSFQNTNAQKHFLPGYILPLKGDTMKGWIDYRNWEWTPDKISFKTSEAGDANVYRPLQIKEFVVADEVYESAVIQTEVSPSDVSDLTYNPALQFGSDTTFVQSMIRGKKSLYYYKSKFGKELYYIKQDSLFELWIFNH